MNEWKTVRLGDVFDLQMGKTPERKNLDFFSTTDNKWISIADISKADKYIFETKEFISDEAVKKSGIKQIPANTVIMSFKLSIGKTAITKGPMYSNEAIMAFLPNGKYEVDNDFLYHLFSNKDWSEGSNKAVKGITLNKASLLEVKILLPPLTIQKQIAKTMDKCTEIISKNKRMLENYDTLIKSRFIEMFGDPVQNPMGWEVKKLGKMCSAIMNGTTPKGGEQVYVENGITFLRSQNVWRNKIDLDDVAYIDEATHKSMKKSSLKKYDILMTKTGRINTENSSLGRAALFLGEDDSANINGHVYLIRLEKEYNHEFVIRILTSPEYRDYIRSICVGGIDKRQVNKDHIEDFPIIQPSKEKQEEFSAFVQQIDKSKFTVQKSLEKAETLYKSLMQQYFA